MPPILIVLLFLLYIVSLGWGGIYFMYRVFHDGAWAFIVPSIGCYIGLWFSLKLAIFLVKNVDQLRLGLNIFQNVMTLFKMQIEQGSAKSLEMLTKLSLPPEKFKVVVAEDRYNSD